MAQPDEFTEPQNRNQCLLQTQLASMLCDPAVLAFVALPLVEFTVSAVLDLINPLMANFKSGDNEEGRSFLPAYKLPHFP